MGFHIRGGALPVQRAKAKQTQPRPRSGKFPSFNKGKALGNGDSANIFLQKGAMCLNNGKKSLDERIPCSKAATLLLLLHGRSPQNKKQMLNTEKIGTIVENVKMVKEYIHTRECNGKKKLQEAHHIYVFKFFFFSNSFVRLRAFFVPNEPRTM